MLLAALSALIPNVIWGKLGDWLAGIVCQANSKRKRIAEKNLALCFPDWSQEQRMDSLYQHMRISSHLFLGYGRLILGSLDALKSRFDINGLDIVEASVARGDNIIFLAPHFMAMEYAGINLAGDYNMSTMTRLHKNAVLDWVVTRMRKQSGGTVFSRDTNMLAVVRSIRSGLWFYYLPDEDYGSDKSIFIPFFGIEKATIPMLGKLAREGNSSVITILSVYNPDTRRFAITFFPPLEQFPSGDTETDATHMNQEIERLIKLAPEQYYWTSKVFRSRPPGEKRFY